MVHRVIVWILVVGSESGAAREGGAVDVLQQLGCNVRATDLWASLDDEELRRDPPTAVLIEALEDSDDVQRVTANFELPDEILAEAAG